MRQSIERVSLVTLKVSCWSVTSLMTDICRYHVITVYEKSYNKCFITRENKYRSIDMENNEKNKFKVEPRMMDKKFWYMKMFILTIMLI